MDTNKQSPDLPAHPLATGWEWVASPPTDSPCCSTWTRTAGYWTTSPSARTVRRALLSGAPSKHASPGFPSRRAWSGMSLDGRSLPRTATPAAHLNPVFWFSFMRYVGLNMGQKMCRFPWRSEPNQHDTIYNMDVQFNNRDVTTVTASVHVGKKEKKKGTTKCDSDTPLKLKKQKKQKTWFLQ